MCGIKCPEHKIQDKILRLAPELAELNKVMTGVLKTGREQPSEPSLSRRHEGSGLESGWGL